MSTFTCERCTYTTTQKPYLIKHLKRKGACEPVDPEHDLDRLDLLLNLTTNPDAKYSCKWCDCKYAQQSNVYRHQRICANKPSAEQETSEATVPEQMSQNEVQVLRDCIKGLQKEVAMLKQQNNIRTNQTNQTINNNTTNNNNITNNIIILNSFGSEKLDHITEEYLIRSLQDVNSSVPNMFKDIHFNDDLPENQNLRLKSKKQKMLEKYENGVWSACDMNDTLEGFIKDKSKDLLKCQLRNKDFEPDLSEADSYICSYYNNICSGNNNQVYKIRRVLNAIVVDHSEKSISSV